MATQLAMLGPSVPVKPGLPAAHAQLGGRNRAGQSSVRMDADLPGA